MEMFPMVLGVVFVVIVFAIFQYREVRREKAIEKAKTEFVSLISHQLRTPPATIKWYAEMLLRDEQSTLTEDQKRYIKQIFTSSQQMVTLTNALLNISRLEMGSFAIEPETIDITTISKHTLDGLKNQSDLKKIQVKEEYEQGLPTITADPKFVSLIFQNILTNAINYSSENGQITVAVTKDGKDKIRIKISDTGCGIPLNQQSKIFEKLFRADNARMIDRKGNGLGLYITKSIIKQMGGNIWFDSEENKGCNFYITLPIASIQKMRHGMRLD